jgi:hypothetical protein
MFMNWKGLGKVRFLSHDWMAKRRKKATKRLSKISEGL